MSAIEPTAAQLEALGHAAAGDDGPVVMLNLLRFAEGGAESYGRYGVEVVRFLERAGGSILLALSPQQSVIGPEAAEWDLAIAVQYPSRAAFLAMISDPEYLAIHVHRATGLADSRLIACAALPI